MPLCHVVASRPIRSLRYIVTCTRIRALRFNLCTDSCTNLVDGDYQHCRSCTVLTCSNGRRIKTTRCPDGTECDDDQKMCDASPSPTCSKSCPASSADPEGGGGRRGCTPTPFLCQILCKNPLNWQQNLWGEPPVLLLLQILDPPLCMIPVNTIR